MDIIFLTNISKKVSMRTEIVDNKNILYVLNKLFEHHENMFKEVFNLIYIFYNTVFTYLETSHSTMWISHHVKYDVS